MCDRLEPFAHGTVLRCAAHPGFWAFNALRVEGPRPELTAEALAADADRYLGGLAHRRVDLDDAPTAERLRPAFDALGWVTERLVWLALHDPPPGPDAEEVPVAATRALRLEWARSEDDRVLEQAELDRQADAEEAVLARLGGRSVVARDEGGEPIGFVTFTARDGMAEVEAAYLTPAHRGRGIGGGLVAAAARAAGGRETLLVADDEGDAKRLYLRLGFEPVWIEHVFTRKPSATLG
ncbi:MAG TPA: GNAT family N-acetyltransferase [Solirubrobacteraceae bacterium]|nr:GNAT family N-acetyltransferase [Solirubrobacteraceae bacterium]